MNTLIVSMKGREKRLAVIKNGQADQFHVFQPSHASRVGFIYYGLVSKVEKGMNACFVNIGLEKNAYLHRNDLPDHQNKPISELLHQGQKIIVQVTKDGSEMKAPRLSAVVEWPGGLLVYLPEGGYVALSKKIGNDEKRREWTDWIEKHKQEKEGLIVRTAALNEPKEAMLAEWKWLRSEHEKLVKRAERTGAPALLMEKQHLKDELFARMHALGEGELICDELGFLSSVKEDPRFENCNWPSVLHSADEEVFSAYGLREAADVALKRVVWLPSGGFIVIDRTEAMTVIDVNTGKFTGKSSQGQTVLLTNKEAAAECIRQLRLRDISGIILIDFIDMLSEADREKVEKLLIQEAKKDPKQISIRGFTTLGLMQITRKKTKPSLLETMTVPCRTCHGKGRVISAETAAFQLERKLFEYARSSEEAVLVEVTSDVMTVFAGEKNEYHEKLEELLHKKIIYRVINADLPTGKFVRAGAYEDLAAKGTSRKRS
ncbi:Rne/Rng family ribonuclease [Bacillus aerolatus]|uniref:Rne/Rng family ribonuclease n=1 Tax=Bacillus aerolatus TaxID=2653354 RepID=A0A6I1FIX3_9BACI|nr:Rne/Rng family ribonuclease [Bacillus aerolatus]KAB7708625.1 Rne/Rng family ribonuclease [Bacillus aerolatus]